MAEKFNKEFCEFAKSIYGNDFIPLHRPIFEGNERRYLVDCIDSNFVSSVGEKVTDFERKVAEFTGASYTIATVNGTAALHVALKLSGVEAGDEVITQALTFVATCNAISYCGAAPVFIDADFDTLGMSPSALKAFLDAHVEVRNGRPINKSSGRRIAGCIPMHTFGFPCRVEEIANICADWGIALIEDSAESLGSYVKGAHTGTLSLMSTLSFNGNKVITTGGGGMLLTNDADLARRAKHITTTAKIPHAYEFVHDRVAFNYRMPNLNAALGCAQMERLTEHLSIKANLADKWEQFLSGRELEFVRAIEGCEANHWLNAIVFKSKSDRDDFLEYTNDNGVMTRPIWRLMSELDMYKNCQNDGLINSIWLQDRVVNIPSSVPDDTLPRFE